MQVEPLPESVQPTTERGVSMHTAAPNTITPTQESSVDMNQFFNPTANQTGELETEFVPAFTVERHTNATQLVENHADLEPEEHNLHRSNGDIRRMVATPSIVPFDLVFDDEVRVEGVL